MTKQETIWLLRCLLTVLFCNIQAQSQCPNCLANSCWSDGGCKRGCKPGHWGYWCAKQCPSTCVSCDRYNEGNCNECNIGFYGSDCSNTCSAGCSNNVCDKTDGQCSCITGFTGEMCDQCLDGKYGSNCSNTCSVGCSNNVCDKTDGQCSCKTGFNGEMCDQCLDEKYGFDCSNTCSVGCNNNACNKADGQCSCKTGFIGDICDQCEDGRYGIYCNACKLNCIKCSSSEICTLCKNGYYSGTYQDLYTAYSSFSDCRHDCRPTCSSCSSYSSCSECKTGYYAIYCQSTCPNGCLNGNCNKVSGYCVNGCKFGFTGDQCDECAGGKYGTDCNLDCLSITCAGGFCDSNSGYCTSCGTYDYGNLCQYKCSTNCFYGEYCDINGTCKYGCKNGYFGQTCQDECPSYCDKDNEEICDTNGACSSCGNRQFGLSCENNCPDTCSSCNSLTDCSSCDAGTYGSTCEYTCPRTCMTCTVESCSKCKIGYYGTNCSSECPSNCKIGTECNKDDGNCLRECVEGKTGHDCNSNCNKNCKSCQRNAYYLCTECVYGKYGYSSYNHCTYNCPSNCFNKTCDVKSGNCVFGCIDGYTGLQCDCPTTCGSCHFNGQCSSCKDGFENPQKMCHCRKDVCNNDTCDYCNNSTWYVDTGSQYCCRCSDNCKYNECHSEAICSKGCISGYYGQACNMLCSVRDVNCVECSLESDGYFKCNQCKDGFYPNNDKGRCAPCNVHCIGNICNSITGTCDECDDGYWENRCERSCPEGCLQCNHDDGTCDICSGGKYGRKCSLICSLNCKASNGEAMCAIQDGTCKFGCSLKTVYGKMCELECGEYCFDRKCDWSTGECINCEINKYGPTCGMTCGDNCLSDKTTTRCFQNNGTCTSGCQPGFYGDRCERSCSKNCNNYTCERLSGKCHFGCNGDFTDATCVQAFIKSDPGAVIGGAVGGVVAVVLVVLIVLAVIFIMRKRRINKPQYDYANDVNQNMNNPGPMYSNTLETVNLYSLPTSDTADTIEITISNPNYEQPPEPIRMSTLSAMSLEELEEEPDVLPPKINPAADRTYANVVRRIQVHKLAEYVAKKTTADFEEEYQDFKHGLQEDISFAESQKPNNMARNRYKCIYPYDDHRVKLTGTGTDYINASYIDGFNKQNEYIACLGPTEKTTDKYVNFWRMVWQQKVEKIVMVTNLFENGGHKCDQYWPDTGTSVSYGDVTVTCHSEDIYADYTVRSFTVSQKSQNRSLYHIHFTAWPDKGVPDDVTSLIEFRQKVKSTQTTLNGPTIVHCSAGVGRTGTYIALDILTNEGEAQKIVDIFDCVEHMREHRVNMVQTAEQYGYLHHAVVHSLTFECQAIQGDKFQQFISSLGDSDLQKMFERLQATAEKETQGETEAVQKHKTLTKLNREGANVPGDRHRPKLYLHRKPGSSDYINAVFMNSFRSKDRYIVAQTPLPETVLDFICLVYQTNCKCIVSMEPMEALKGKKVGKYFPADNQTLKLEPFRITSVIEESTPQYQLRKLTIAHTGQGGPSERAIYHFQFRQWKEKQSVPVDPTAILQLVKDVDTKANKSEDEGPIIIHCLNGGEKSGLFCAVSVLIQKMAIEHEVSVVNTVRMVKSRRASAIPDKEQYSFCYQCVSAYLQSFDIYSNFSLRI